MAAILKRSFLNKPTHGLRYPGAGYRSQDFQKLQLTPSTARELVLLAELVGWPPYLPIVLDMATRPEDLSLIHCNTTLGFGARGYDLRRIHGGFRALKVLSSEYEVSQCRKCVSYEQGRSRICLAEKARGPGTQPLTEILPKLAAAVAQTGLRRSEALFATGASAFESRVQAGYRRFILNIALIISDLAKHVAEDGKLGGCRHFTVHAQPLDSSSSMHVTVSDLGL